ncbi:two-component regulator propeller domain-containing protein [Flavobacteriaceae bacterium LMO-SS05]
MLNRIKISLFYFFIIGCFVGFAQDAINQKQFAFKTLTINDGLSQNSVIDIAQDSIGYLWLATQDGLNKYDGKQFIHYNKQFEDITRPSFSKLGKVYIDIQNRLWIITSSGNLELYHTATDSFKPFSSIVNVSNIFQDKHLNFYIGTFDNGLYKINYSTKDTIQILEPQDAQKSIYNFKEIDNDILVSASETVFKIGSTGDYIKIEARDTPKTNFSVIEQSKDGTLWLGSYGNGLFYIDLNNQTILPFSSNGLPADLNIEDLHIDSKNRLWIATYGNGAYLYDLSTNQLTNFKANKNNPFAIHYNDILCLFEDVTGNIWLGSDGTGASYYDQHLIKFNVLTNDQVPKSVNVDVVRSITTDNKTNLWVGTSGKGLTFIDFKADTYKTYTTSNSPLLSNRIISLSFQDDELWVGHQGFGLNIINNKNQFKSFPEIKDLTIWRIVYQSKNQSWLCTESNGIILYDKNQGTLKQYHRDNSALTTNNVKTLVKGNSNTLWVGTEHNGLFKFDTKTENFLKIKQVEDKIKSLYFSDDILWIGTNGNGLKRLNTKTETIQTFTIDDGLPNNVIYGILQDAEGNLWLSTNYGISKAKLAVDSKITFENFNNNDGLQALEFNTGAYYQDPYGTLYFGGLEGINWFQPNQISFNPIQPKTIITGFQVFAKDQSLAQNTAFNYKQNTVTFTFSSLHFSQPERNAYKYQLINHDENWVSSGNINTAHYTNLSPNDYTFRVISSNYDGVWNLTPTTFKFTIKQPWYLSHIAIFSYFLLLVIVIYNIYKYLKWRWQIKMQLQFEQTETERLKKLDDFKTKLYTNISHEFRTPLTLITGPIERQLENPDLSKEAKKELTLAHRNSNRLLNLVNQLLDLSKLESGSLKLSVKKGNLGVFLKQLSTAFEYIAEEKQLHFMYQTVVLDNVWFDVDVIEKIVTNLLNNAIKYAPINGHVIFNTQVQGGQIILTFINNGNTLKDEELPKLFQRYFQKQNSSDGVGIGLALVKELAILSHGNIIANTMNQEDIQFTVTLPIERSYFNSSEIIMEDNIISETQLHIVNTNQDDYKASINNEKPLLLIIEDDKDIREYIVSILGDSYKTTEANNGKQGIDKALKLIPDLIICDIMMPIKDGIEVCNTLKFDERSSHIPIILLTAKVGEENEIIGLKTGADAYITKPFNSEKLKVRVEKLIQLRHQLQQRYQREFDFQLKDGLPATVEQQFIKRLHQVLEIHMSNPAFKSQDISDKMLMSRMQLHRKIKALTGLSTSEFLKSQRVKLAENLLKQTDLSISEIAYQVGFNSPSYFSSCFKDIYNCTPNEYQETK